MTNFLKKIFITIDKNSNKQGINCIKIYSFINTGNKQVKKTIENLNNNDLVLKNFNQRFN